ncbi:hypothetical protein ACET3Z_000466 [Daucus carota]
MSPSQRDFSAAALPLSQSLRLLPKVGKMVSKLKKTTLRKQQKKKVNKIAASAKKAEAASTASAAADFLPLEGGPARKIPASEKKSEDKATVLYIGRIPHGFYETEMEGFFKQFGTIKRLRIARNRKTGKSKNFGFIQFESPEVAKIVAETMHNYLLFEHLLQVQLIPPERVHPKVWKGVSRWYTAPDWVQIERSRHDKERTLEGQRKLLERIMKKDQKRRKRIEDAGIDYKCPEIVGSNQPLPKKIKFAD